MAVEPEIKFTATPKTAAPNADVLLEWEVIPPPDKACLAVLSDGFQYTVVGMKGSKKVSARVSTRYKIQCLWFLKTGIADVTVAEPATPVPPTIPPTVPPTIPPTVPPTPPTSSTLPILPRPVRTELARISLTSSQFAYGGLTIDFGKRHVYVSGKGGDHVVYRYDLPLVENWPTTTRIDVAEHIPDWYSGGNNWISANSLCFWQDKVWAATTDFFQKGDTTSTSFIARDGERLPNPLGPAFAGFYKSAPGVKPMLGAGGITSSIHDRCGPTLATWEDSPRVLLDWPYLTAPHETKCMRTPDYEPVGTQDEWVSPPIVDGKGRWGTEDMRGGGIFDGTYYRCWPKLGVGPRNYKWPDGGQSPCLSLDWKTDEYCLHGPNAATPHTLAGWSEYGRNVQVYGSEIDAAGRLYLLVGDAWMSKDMELVIYDSVKGK